jgi:hypothetical protein
MASVGALLQPLLPDPPLPEGSSLGTLDCLPKDVVLLLLERFGPRCRSVCRGFRVLSQHPRVMAS